MPWPVHPTGFLASRGDEDTYKIERSLRFNSADSAYLDRTPASAGNLTTWTWSGWFKRSKLGASQTLFSSGTSAVTLIHIQADDTLRLRNSTLEYVTTQVFRDVSAWYHLVVRWETGNATAGDRVRVYINGSEINSFSTETHAGSNEQSEWNKAQSNQIGRYAFNGTLYFDGYLTEINFIDGQALTPSSFGETDAITGRWKAKAYSGTYGTNGFYLKFADNSGTTATTLGKDSSGNGNNWTPNNFSVTAGADNDSLLDSPTNRGTSGNYCTLNPFLFRDESSSGYVSGASYISDGNLKLANGSTSYYYHGGTIGAKSGKWYFEAVVNGVEPTYGNFPEVGFVHIKDGSYRSSGFDPMSITMKSDTFYGNLGTTYVANDIVRIAIDIDNGKIWFGKNNSWLNSGDPSTGSSGITTPSITGYVFPSIAIYGTSSITVNFGQRPFAYTAPTGFKALCTTNLPQPTIQKPSKYMDVVTYTGTGAALTPTSSLGFSPDLVWIKGRSGATDHALYDTVRGAEKRLESNNTDAEVTSDGGVTSFDSGGFTLGTLAQVNTNTSTYVAWAWDEAPIAGMDIVGYTGNGVARTIAHNLGVAPKMMIVKNRTSALDSWAIYHSVLGAGKYLLFTTGAEASSVNMWNNTAPTSSVFSVGITDDTNRNNGSFIAYLFAEVEGFSKFGSYTGNAGSDDLGPFVYTGFRPKILIIKNATTGGTDKDWVLFDSVRKTINVINFDDQLALNSSVQEGKSSSGSTPTGRCMDFLSNGFKIRDNASWINGSGDTLIFAAFAESPFKYARAR